MLLLIFVLGLFAKLAMVSGDCELGPPTYNNFNWTRFAGPRPWYTLLHKPNDFENNFDCPTATIGMPEENRISTTSAVYIISLQRHVTVNGNITYWNSSGYFEASHPLSMMSVMSYVIATDYDRYAIFKQCVNTSNETSNYVSYRSRHPDEATKNDVLGELQDNNIDATQLVDWPANHCQEPESSAAGGSTA